MSWFGLVELGLFLLLGGIAAWVVFRPIQRKPDSKPK